MHISFMPKRNTSIYNNVAIEVNRFWHKPTRTQKKLLLKCAIKSKYQQNIDHNQLDFHNIIADITVITSKMQNGAYSSPLRWYLKKCLKYNISISLHFLIKAPKTSSNLYLSTSTTIDK